MHSCHSWLSNCTGSLLVAPTARARARRPKAPISVRAHHLGRRVAHLRGAGLRLQKSSGALIAISVRMHGDDTRARTLAAPTGLCACAPLIPERKNAMLGVRLCLSATFRFLHGSFACVATSTRLMDHVSRLYLLSAMAFAVGRPWSELTVGHVAQGIRHTRRQVARAQLAQASQASLPTTGSLRMYRPRSRTRASTTRARASVPIGPGRKLTVRGGALRAR
mmetsp:Transcript_46099/g.107819  ORF Transcript_46099/g.107819 Transcript_46099/m.107819 type:complete len:222 (+) Transcript_46099:1613-2278(+)